MLDEGGRFTKHPAGPTLADSSTKHPPSPGDETATPLAVALKYTHRVDETPRVIAKGDGALAEQIRAIAVSQGIEVREDADLAQLLMAVDLESPIPVEAYEAVARILSYIYHANHALKTQEHGP
jgi:flagellar biosynthesis protein